MTKLLSVVVSVYNEELALREFYAETGKILKTLPADWDYNEADPGDFAMGL